MSIGSDFLDEGRILHIPEETKYWLVRANGGKFYDDFFLNDYIAVSDNKIKLDEIQKYSHLANDLGATQEVYKKIYEKAYPDHNSQQISISAKRTFHFVELIKTNDIVLVPSKNSNEFLLGIVSTDVYEVNDVSNDQIKGLNYTPCPYQKRRRVKWIKTIERRFISYEMRWILSAHQTIYDLSLHADHIDKLLSPIYIKGDKCYGIIHIGTEEGINVKQWMRLYGIVDEVGGEDSNKVIVKNSVRSPGIVEYVTELAKLPTVISALIITCGLTMGGIKLKNFEIQGIVSYFFNEGKISRDKKKLENKMLETEVDLKRLELLDKQKQLGINQYPHQNSNSDLKNDLKITLFHAGRVVQSQKKKDSDDDSDEE